MATLDFAPLLRSSIGFYQLPGLLSHALERPEATFPPYNIEKVGTDQYRIVIALAGFQKEDVEIVQEQSRLIAPAIGGSIRCRISWAIPINRSG